MAVHLLPLLDEPRCHGYGRFPDVEVDRVRVAAVVDHGQGRVEGLPDVPRGAVEPGAADRSLVLVDVVSVRPAR